MINLAPIESTICVFYITFCTEDILYDAITWLILKKVGYFQIELPQHKTVAKNYRIARQYCKECDNNKTRKDKIFGCGF